MSDDKPITQEQFHELNENLKRLERINTKHQVTHTVQGVLNPQQQQADYDIIMEAADPDGYGTASPAEVAEAQGRMNIRSYLVDPQLSQIALKHNISAEQLTEALIKKGGDKVVESRQKGATTFFNDLMGFVSPKPGEGRKASDGKPLTPQQVAEMQKVRAKGRGTDDDLADMINIVLGDDPLFDV